METCYDSHIKPSQSNQSDNNSGQKQHKSQTIQAPKVHAYLVLDEHNLYCAVSVFIMFHLNNITLVTPNKGELNDLIIFVPYLFVCNNQ